MKIHFLAFGSSFDLFSSGTCTYAMQPNTLRCETSGLARKEHPCQRRTKMGITCA
jgi:hypothetical protein